MAAPHLKLAAETDRPAPKAAPAAPAAVIPLKRKEGPTAMAAKRWGKWTVENLIPPALTVALLLLIWQIAFSGQGATLPSPTRVWAEANDLILQPFYWAGSQDIGLAGAC